MPGRNKRVVVFEMPQSNSGSLNASSAAHSAKWRSGAAGSRTSVLSMPRRPNIASGLTINDSSASVSMFYGTIIGDQLAVNVISSEALSEIHFLNLRTDLHHYADSPFWGTDDPRTLQLALALLASALGNDHRALALHRLFAARVIMTLPCGLGWELSQTGIVHWVEQEEASLGISWMNVDGAYLEELHL